MIDLATKQAFWCEQLPNFEAKYWLPSHFEFLIFDKDQGNYVIKEDLDPSFEDEATEIFHRVNTGWAMWKKAINFNDQQAEIDSLKAENAALKERLQKIEDGEFVVVPKECPDPIFADKLFDLLCKKAHGEFGDDQMIFFSDIDESAIWKTMIEAAQGETK